MPTQFRGPVSFFNAIIAAGKQESVWNGRYNKWMCQDPCAYCGGPGGELDHIEPLILPWRQSRIGTRRQLIDNCTGACRYCNTLKRRHSAMKFLLLLRVYSELEPMIDEWKTITETDFSIRRYRYARCNQR